MIFLTLNSSLFKTVNFQIKFQDIPKIYALFLKDMTSSLCRTKKTPNQETPPVELIGVVNYGFQVNNINYTLGKMSKIIYSSSAVKENRTNMKENRFNKNNSSAVIEHRINQNKLSTTNVP